MTTVLAVALGLPLLGALVVGAGVLFHRAAGARTVATIVGGLTAASWALLVTADTPPELGRVVADPVAASAVAGLAVLVAARLPARPVAAGAGLCGVTVFAVGATTSATAGGADRPLAAAVAALVALVVVHARAEQVPVARLIGLGLGGLVVAVGMSVEPTDTVAALVVLGAGTVLATSLWCLPGLVLAPIVALSTVRAVPDPSAITSGLDRGTSHVAVAGLVVVALGTVAVVARSGGVARLRRPAAADPHPSRSGRSSVALGGATTGQNPMVAPWVAMLAGTALLAQDLTGFRSAGLLLVAGGVLAAASMRPVAMIAAVPGLAAGMAELGSTSAPVEAATAVAAGVALIVAVIVTDADVPVDWRDWRMFPPVVFGLVPLWGWTGAELDGYSAAVATAGAAGVTAAVVVTASRVAGVDPRAIRGRVAGRLRRRPPALRHGSTNPLAEEADSLDVDRSGVVRHRPLPRTVGDAPEEPGPPPEPAVATPPGAVRPRPAAGRLGGRGRLRPRPGRPPR